jgi:hypothetical protein
VSGAQRGHVEALSRVGFQAVGLDDEVGVGEERRDAGISGRPDDRLLARVQVREERRVLAAQVATRRRPAAQGVPGGRLDLDDLGARVDEELRAVRACDLRREVEHVNAGQSALLLGFRSIPHGATPGAPGSRAAPP